MSQTRSCWSLEHAYVVSSTPRNLFFQFNIKNLQTWISLFFLHSSQQIRLTLKKWESDLVDVWFFFPRKSFTLPSGISFWNIVGTSQKRWVSFRENPEGKRNVFHFYQIYIMVKNWWFHILFFFDEKMKKFKICLWLDHTKTWDDRVFFPKLVWIIPRYCRL